MAQIRDCMLTLSSFPDPTPEFVIDHAVEFTRLMGARLTALMFFLDRQQLTRVHSRGEWLLDIPRLIDEGVRKSANESNRLLDHFETTAKRLGVFQAKILEGAPVYISADHIIEHARLHDLTFVPVVDPNGFDELYTESIVFGSGRPTILLPAFRDEKAVPPSLDIVAVAWDYSRAAARALADAMSILEKAKQVRVFTVINEKPIAQDTSSTKLEEHLRMHGINAAFENVDAGGRAIGRVIDEYLRVRRADLLVMGAFAHSRMREFILGGATRSIVNHPPIPVLLSH